MIQDEGQAELNAAAYCSIQWPRKPPQAYAGGEDHQHKRAPCMSTIPADQQANFSDVLEAALSLYNGDVEAAHHWMANPVTGVDIPGTCSSRQGVAHERCTSPPAGRKVGQRKPSLR